MSWLSTPVQIRTESTSNVRRYWKGGIYYKEFTVRRSSTYPGLTYEAANTLWQSINSNDDYEGCEVVFGIAGNHTVNATQVVRLLYNITAGEPGVFVSEIGAGSDD